MAYELNISAPSWLTDYTSNFETFDTVEQRMLFAIGLADENVKRKTGGPFGAALFDLSNNQLISPGVNLVAESRCSHAHAEMLAIAFAQQSVKTHELSKHFPSGVELVTSVEPCAMCLGAIPWAGISKVVCGAKDEDARAIGFDEGSKPEKWIAELEARDIEVVEEVLRDQAVIVLQRYLSQGGEIYNGMRQNH